MAIKKKLLKDVDWSKMVSEIPVATRTTPGMMTPIDKRFMPQTLMGNTQSGLFIFGAVPRGMQLGFILLSLGHIEGSSMDAGTYIIRVHEDANNGNRVSAKIITLDGGNPPIKVFLKDGRILAITRASLWHTINYISTISFVEDISRQDGTDGFEVIAE